MNVTVLDYPQLSDFISKNISTNSQLHIYYYFTGKSFDKERVESELTRNGFSIAGTETISFDKKNHDDFVSEYLSWLHCLSEKKILGKPLKKWFVFDGRYSLWWFSSLSQRKKNKTPLPKYMECAFLFENFSNKLYRLSNGSDVVVIIDDDNYLNIIEAEIRSSFKGKHVKEFNLNVIRGNKLKKKIISSIKKGINSLMYFIQTWKKLIQIHFFLRRIYANNKHNKSSNRVLLISDLSDLVKNTDKYLNTYFPHIQKELNKRNYELVSVYCKNNDLLDYKDWNDLAERNIVLEGGNNYQYLYPGFFALFRVILSSIKWLVFSKIIFIVGRWNDVSTYKSVNFKDLITNDINKLTLRQASILSYYYLCWKKLLTNLRPAVVIYRKEFNSFGRVISAAASSGTKMIGVQHGMVNNDQYGYLYLKNEIDINSSARSDYISYCPCPDKVAVFGTRMKEYMTKYGFPDSKVSVIGSLRHDRVITGYPYPEVNYELKNKLLQKFGIAKNKFIITLCGQWAMSTGHWFKMIVKTLKQLNIDAYLIVKPHPLENKETENAVLRFAKELNFTDYKFLTEKIEDVLYVSDVAVTHSSTSGIDALLLGVPVITIHQDGLPNNNELFSTSDACVEVFNVHDLMHALTELCAENGSKKQWQLSRQKFLEYNLRNMDGKAHDRLTELF